MSDTKVAVQESQTAEPAKTFTQDEVNQIIEGRLARERAKYADYDDLVAFRDEHKSEAEKAIERARAEGADEARKALTPRLATAEVKGVAASLGYRDPADAIAVFGSLDDVVSKGGDVDSDAISARLGEIAKAKPYLLNERTTPATRPSLRRGDNKMAGETKAPRAAEALRAYSRSR